MGRSLQENAKSPAERRYGFAKYLALKNLFHILGYYTSKKNEFEYFP